MEKVRQLLQEALRLMDEGPQEGGCVEATPKPGDKDTFLAWREAARKALEKAFSKVQEKNLALNEALNAVGVNPGPLAPSEPVCGHTGRA